MATQLSPGVNVSEIDLSTVVSTVASTDAAISGIFNWGPVHERVLIDSESKLVSVFGPPNSNNAETWFSAANFLAYGNSLYVVRTANTTTNTATISAHNSYANVGALANTTQVIKNRVDFESKAGTYDTNLVAVARSPGGMGNSLKVSFCDSVNAYSSVLHANGNLATTPVDVLASLSIDVGNANASLAVIAGANGTTANAVAYATAMMSSLSVGDYILLGNTSIGQQLNKIATIGSVTSNTLGGFATLTFTDPYRLAQQFIANNSTNETITRYWEYYAAVGAAPSKSAFQTKFGTNVVDGIHVVVVDEDGAFSNTPGTILESYVDLSRATDSKNVSGDTNYYRTVINQNSNYVWLMNDRTGAVSNTAANLTASTTTGALTLSFTGGHDGYSESTAPLAVLARGYDFFRSSEHVDVSLILQGKPIGGTGGSNYTISWQLANYIIDNIIESRRDAVLFVTPDDGAVTNNSGNESTGVVTWRNSLHDSSFTVVDSGYKYQYDKYNDVYRYIPLNGDIAGLCARTDKDRDPWWSPAGFNRGQIKNLVKLRWNPNSTDRDILYKNNINPVVTFPGQGTYLYGDKTLQSKASAFDRINVRRLFIVLEKAISIAAKSFLFEFNDEFTRAQFKNLVTPYLRDIQGRRGITDFLVVCDSTNNTAERVDRNEFWGDIYIKPAPSINFIKLNFVAVSTGVQFSEIVGQL